MSFNKRKITPSDTFDGDNSFTHRRSSMRVNLSYTSLSDSGNGSLGKTQVGNDEKVTDMPQANRKLLRRKHRFNSNTEVLQTTSDTSKDVVNDSKISLQHKERVQLKHLTINLEDISAKEQTLDTNCKRLKDAILSKTKEIFNKQDELSIRTTMVLGNKEKSPTSTIQNLEADNKSVFILDRTNQCFDNERNERSMICHQYTDSANHQLRQDQYSNIVATPKNSERQKSIRKTINRSKLTPKRLFIEKDKSGCRIIEDIILTKNFTVFPFIQSDQSNSPVLSSNNKRLQLLRKRSKLFSEGQDFGKFGNHNNTHLTLCSDRSINIGEPLVCSTFIENNPLDEERNKISCNKAHNDINEIGIRSNDDINTSRATCTTNEVVSMEMTEIHNGIQLSEKHTSQESKISDMHNSAICKDRKRNKSENEKLEQNKNIIYMQKLENIDTSINKLNVQNNSTYSNILCANIADNQIKQNKKQCTSILPHEIDSNSVRSSLHVNTSLDIVTETDKLKNIQKSNNNRIIDSSGDTNDNEESIPFDDQHESANTNRTSLQMNTSMDSMQKTCHRKSNCLNKPSLNKNKINENLTKDNRYLSAIENNKASDIDLLENVSLIERLRNISMQNPVSSKNKTEIFETYSKERNKNKSGSNNILSAKCQDVECATNNSGDSCIEGTPYPISRSVLFQSQLKHRIQCLNNQASCSNINSTNGEEDNNKVMSNNSHPTSISDKMWKSTETSKITENDTVSLGDTFSSDPFLTQKKLIEVIEDTLNKTKSETNEKNTVASHDVKCTSVRSRRKLLPLNDNSQCSIIPLEEHSDISEKCTPVKRKKRLNKKRPKRKSASYKNKTNSVKHNITSEQFCSDDDCDIIENKKKENKKIRKPRKIISKKIVIEKFVNESMLSILEDRQKNKGNQTIENGNSSNDFVAYRTIPTQWSKHKNQKIVIVTTGLSKEDKNLVKNIIKSLGKAEMELNVSRRTTHVVSTGVRTVNLLHGIIRGCWLITLEWVLKSLENNMWLNPEEFEMKHFSKAVLENRKDRQLFGPSYIPELFTACGLIYVEHKTALPCDILKELIKTAGGHITENPKLAKISIGVNSLKETWVIDSITTGELQSIKFYQRK